MEHPVRLGDAESKKCPFHLPHCVITCPRVRGGWCTHVIVAGADFESAMPIRRPTSQQPRQQSRHHCVPSINRKYIVSTFPLPSLLHQNLIKSPCPISAKPPNRSSAAMTRRMLPPPAKASQVQAGLVGGHWLLRNPHLLRGGRTRG